MVMINGEQKNAAGKSISELLAEMKLDPKRTAVMIGGEILPKANYDKLLEEGNEVDIIGFVGGG